MNTVPFDHAVVSLDAIQRAAYALSELMTIDIAPTPTGWSCTLHARVDDVSTDELGHRLRARVVDETLRARIAEQTAAVRNLVFAVAYSQTGLTQEEDASGAATAD